MEKVCTRNGLVRAQFKYEMHSMLNEIATQLLLLLLLAVSSFAAVSSYFTKLQRVQKTARETDNFVHFIDIRKYPVPPRTMLELTRGVMLIF